MNIHELCCVGHITKDKIVTPKKTVFMPGGTSFYFSHAIKNFDDIDYALVTALAETEMAAVDALREDNVKVEVMPSAHTVYFENIYGENQDNRTQRVLAKADPFTIDYLQGIEAKIYHLGSLLADDFSLEEVRGEDVFAVDWPEKREFLKHIHFLKANEHEMEVLTGYSSIRKAGETLHAWGVKEVLLTFGSMGSVIYDGKTFHQIPAYIPKETVDATGAGDTYMTGYLYQRAKGASIDEAGRFAAAMSTMKIEGSGPFKGSKADVLKLIETAEQQIPELD